MSMSSSLAEALEASRPDSSSNPTGSPSPLSIKGTLFTTMWGRCGLRLRAETFGASFHQGRVVRVEPEAQVVILDGGEEVRYTHLILCTGSDGPFPGKFNNVADYRAAIQKYEDMVQEIQAASSVVVVGGGTTGVEMAAEIKTDYPDKKVTLIHSRNTLADMELLPSVRQQAKKVLLEMGVELVLEQKVLNLSALEVNVTRKDMTVVTDKGTELKADLVICCTGNKINCAAYRSSLGGCLAEDGALKVNTHLQVEGFDNIYAVGDCANVHEPKMAYHAGLHAGVAVTNIIKDLMGKPLTSYKTGSVTMLVAMGRSNGVGQFSGLKLNRYLVVRGKSKNLLVWKSWSDMGQKPPKESDHPEPAVRSPEVTVPDRPSAAAPGPKTTVSDQL